MAVTKDKPAPYAPPSSILDIIERYRSRGLPSPINSEVLARAGISESLIPRTLQSLVGLDLIDDEGKPTKALEGLRLAPEAEFKQRLQEWLNSTYADVIAFVDPAKDGEVEVRDAFRSYVPVGQQARMVTLFQGLYAAAGVVSDKANQPRKTNTQRQTPRITRPITQTKTRQTNTQAGSGAIPAPIAGLLSGLPQQGHGWTEAKREKFLTTLQAVLDFCFPIIGEGEAETAEEESEE